ncbi:MAG: response regulator transcription factor [Verrucomicrobiota bacterium]
MKVIIVEDDTLTQDNLKLLLQGERGIEWVEAFGSAEQAMKEAPWEKADILLSDIDLPGISGVDLIGWTRLKNLNVSCMAYTIHENRDIVFSAIKAGACGYLLKSSSPRELIESLHDLYDGGAPMTSKIARKVILDLQQRDSDGIETENLLTKREQEILRLIEKGFSYKEVAGDLGISPHTVHTHIKNIYEKVQAGNRDQVVQKARRLGWI